MATVAWDEMLPDLAPFLPGAPDITLRNALRSSASNFLAQTHIWRDEFYPFETTPDVPDYELYSEATIESVLWVLMGEQELKHRDPRRVRKQRINQSGSPQAFWVQEGRKVRLFPTPDDVYTVSGWVVLKPSSRSRGLEDWIVDMWQDAVISGAIHRVAQIPNKGGSDMSLAQYHKQLHDRAIANARVRDLQGVNQHVQMRKI